MSGCCSFPIASDSIVKVGCVVSEWRRALVVSSVWPRLTRQLVICPKKFGSLSRLTGKLQRASQWCGHHNYVYLPPLVHCSLLQLGSTKRDVLPRNNCTRLGIKHWRKNGGIKILLAKILLNTRTMFYYPSQSILYWDIFMSNYFALDIVGNERSSFRDTLAARGVGQPNYIISVSNL